MPNIIKPKGPEKSNKFKYHFEIPHTNTTAKIIKKRSNTDSIPVNLEHWGPPPPLPPRELSPQRVAGVSEGEGECNRPCLTKELRTLKGDETLAGEKPEANPKPDSQEREP